MNRSFPIANISRLRMGTDGDGIRTLIIVNGCTLKCRYCINSFTWDGSKQPQMMNIKDIYNRVAVDRPYIIASNGGMTFGGGEPLLYPDLIKEMRQICDTEMTVFVETALHVKWENIEKCMDDVDRYYVDIKTMNPDIYKEYTGKEIDLALDNLNKLVALKPSDSIVVRIPEIEGLIDKEAQEAAKEKLKELGISNFDLFKYKVFGRS